MTAPGTGIGERQAPTFSVIIVNYRAGDRLRRCLDRLTRQTLAPFEVIVVDNGSDDGSLVEARRSAQAFRLISPSTNLGFAAANNRAAEIATGAWLAFLNPDAYAEPTWLEAVAEGVKRYPSVDAFGSLQVDAADPTRLDGVGDAYFFAGAPYRGGFGEKRSADIPDGECFAPCAAAAFYRRETFAALGGFTEHFFCYGEDVDLGFRLRLAGGRCVQLNRAVVAHEGSGVTGRRSGFTMYHGHRNRIWTYVRNMPGPIFWPGLPFHLLVNAYLLLRFAPRNEAGPYLRALRDAVRAAPREWRARREIQAARVASVAAIARALTWSPLKLAGKRPDLRPLPQPATTEKVG